MNTRRHFLKTAILGTCALSVPVFANPDVFWSTEFGTPGWYQRMPGIGHNVVKRLSTGVMFRYARLGGTHA